MANDPRPSATLWPKGRLFEDFHVGQRFNHHWGRTIFEGDATLFTTLTLSFNPLYFNRAYAKAHGHPDIVVNPQLVFNVVLGLSVEDCSEIGGPFLGCSTSSTSGRSIRARRSRRAAKPWRRASPTVIRLTASSLGAPRGSTRRTPGSWSSATTVITSAKSRWRRWTGASPYADWPAFDVVAQAMGGIMAITGPDSKTPTKVGPGVGDIVPGMMLAFGVLAAIHHARRTGEGQFVDVFMVDAMLAVCERAVWQRSVLEAVAGPEGNHHPFLCPFGMFPAADGFITVAARQDAFFKILCEAVGAADLLTDPRFATGVDRRDHRLALIAALSQHTARFTKTELMQRLGGRIPFGPVMDIAGLPPRGDPASMLVHGGSDGPPV